MYMYMYEKQLHSSITASTENGHIFTHIHMCTHTHTILADIQLDQPGEVGNIWRKSNEIILTQCQLAQVSKSEEFLKGER